VSGSPGTGHYRSPDGLAVLAGRERGVQLPLDRDEPYLRGEDARRRARRTHRSRPIRVGDRDDGAPKHRRNHIPARRATRSAPAEQACRGKIRAHSGDRPENHRLHRSESISTALPAPRTQKTDKPTASSRSIWRLTRSKRGVRRRHERRRLRPRRDSALRNMAGGTPIARRE